MIKLRGNLEMLTNLVTAYEKETDVNELQAIALIMSKVHVTNSWSE